MDGRRWAVYGSIILSIVTYVFFYSNGFMLSYSPEDEGYAGRSDRYVILARGFLKGETSLDVPADPRLVALANPYDPQARIAAHAYAPPDSAYYRGRLFHLHGPLPAAVNVVALGVGLPPVSDTMIVLIFTALASWMCGLVILELVGRFFPAVRPWVPAALHAAIAFSPGFVCLLQRGLWYEASAATGGFFIAATMYGLLKTGWPERFHRLGWAALTGLALGLMVLAKQSLALGAFGFLLAVLTISLADAARGRPGGPLAARLGFLTALGAPAAAGVAVLLAYNHLRFGSPLDLGLQYNMGSYDPSKSAHMLYLFDPALINLARTMVQPIRWIDYFPFLFFPDGGIADWVWATAPRPYASDRTVGVLWSFPALALLPALMALAHWAPAAATRITRPLGRIQIVLTVFLAGNIIVLLMMAGSALRYDHDFYSIMVILFGLYFMRVITAGEGRPRLARVVVGALRRGVGLLIGYGVVFGVLTAFAFRGDNLFMRLNPQLFQTLRHWTTVSEPTLLRAPDDAMSLDRLDALETLSLHLTVSFPDFPDASERHQPILTIGQLPLDWLFIKYVGGKRAVFALDHYGGAVTEGEGFTYEPGRPLPLTIDIDRPKRSLRVTLDGRVVFDRPVELYASLPRTIEIGVNSRGGSYAGDRFTGTLIPAGATDPKTPRK